MGIYVKTTMSYGPAAPEVMDVYLPTGVKGPTPVAYLIHGGAWISGTRAQFEPGSGYATQNTAAWLAQHGIAAVCIDYPLHNWKTGWGSMGMIVGAVERAIAFITSDASALNIDPTRSAAWGMSSGGQIASYLGAKGLVRAVVADSAPEDLASITTMRTVIDQMMPTVWDQRYWSPADNLGPNSAKQWFLAAGSLDSTVPMVQQTEAFGADLTAHNLSALLSLYNGGHAFGSTSPANAQDVVGAQEQWLVQTMAALGGPKGATASAVPAASPHEAAGLTLAATPDLAATLAVQGQKHGAWS
jgi:acetyl esterase/lipase